MEIFKNKFSKSKMHLIFKYIKKTLKQVIPERIIKFYNMKYFDYSSKFNEKYFIHNKNNSWVVRGIFQKL